MTMPQSQAERNLPVFVIPHSLEFVTTDASKHKLTLTLLNPYDFTIRFKIYCTAPTKYNVIEPEGCLKSQKLVDVVIRHTEIKPQNEGKVDTFRINIFRSGESKIIGRRDLTSVLIRRPRELSPTPEEAFHQLPQVSPTIPRVQGAALATTPKVSDSPARHVDGKPRSPDLLLVSIAFLCLVVLMVPMYGTESSILPDSVRVGHEYKLVAAFVLGMVTTAILRT